MAEQLLPLEKKVVTVVNSVTSNKEELPALHCNHVRDIHFLEYTLPIGDDDVDNEWVESLQIINDDLHWLLSQSHWLFWSQVVFDVSLQKFLDSYLHLAPRPHDYNKLKCQDSCRHLMDEVNRRVFMVFLRMSTHKENKEHFIAPAVFGDILYQHFLFDIPKIFDLCSIYGQDNSALLGKMISNVFSTQPRYLQDLSATIDSIYELLDRLMAKVTGKDNVTSQPLSSNQLSPKEVTDWIQFVMDIFHTINVFLLVHPSSCRVLQSKQFAQRLAGYYDAVIPVLQDKWRLLKNVIPHDKWVVLKLYLRATKRNLVTIIHQLLTHCYVDVQVTTEETSESALRSDESDSKSWEDFLSVVTVLVTEKSFLKEFEKHFSFEQMISSMKEQHGSVDETNFTYIIEAVQIKKPSSVVEPSNSTVHVPRESPSLAACAVVNNTCSEAVQSVKELFPHLEISFIETLIASHGGDPSAVIDAILEGRVGNDLDKNSAKQNDDVKKKSLPTSDTELESLLTTRSNIYDHDEFDVFHHGNVDLSRVHIGKKFDDGNAFLDDKSHIEDLKTRLIVEDFDQYEDEYDDTYDTHNVGAADADSADEMVSVKRLNEKGLYAVHYENEEDSGKENQEDTTEVHDNPPPVGDNATVQPHYVGHGQRQPKWSHDHKGQHGQYKRTLHTPDKSSSHSDDNQRGRVNKERHKGSRANHNRKDRAQQKMKKGMF
ncbi:activating signal cointegrator 1 complex subunit 2-like [Dysidea avara]|uniref:activating signal cointegrator 1 complex subunit 2-like n=1 Tax=Dysidea avara TaxID=196820 RepID=UPI003321D869